MPKALRAWPWWRPALTQDVRTAGSSRCFTDSTVVPQAAATRSMVVDCAARLCHQKLGSRWVSESSLHERAMPQVARRKLGTNTSQEVDQLRRLQAALDVGLGETEGLGAAVALRADGHTRVARELGRGDLLPRPDRSWRELSGARCGVRLGASRRGLGRGSLPAQLAPLTLPLPACAETVAAARRNAPAIRAARMRAILQKNQREG